MNLARIAASQPASDPPARSVAAERAEATSKPAAATSTPADNTGETSNSATSAPRTKVHRVIVPVDDQRRPAGDKYYIPQELYSQLYRQAASASGQPKGWLITRGFYEGTLARDPVSGRFTLAQLKANFDVEVSQPNVRVQLPFAIEGGVNPIVAARLEGRSVTPQWSADGTSLVIGPLAPDRYRIEFDLRPQQQSEVSASGFDLAIPALAGATFELVLPADAPVIEVPSAIGPVEVRKNRGKLFAQLGPSNRLTVRWPTAGLAELAGANLEVEELIWAKVGPGTTVLDARFKYRVLEGRVARLRVLADPRLRLLPPATQRLISAIHTVPGDPQKIEFELRSPSAMKWCWTCHSWSPAPPAWAIWACRGSNRSAPERRKGGWRFPSIRACNTRFKRAKTPKSSTCRNSWPRGRRGQQTAGCLPNSTRPVDVGAGHRTGATHHRGRADADGEHGPQPGSHPIRRAADDCRRIPVSGRIALPPSLAVEQISLLEDGVQRVARWSVDASGRATVFLTAPVNGRQLLTLRGQLDGLNSGAVELPNFELQSATIKKREFRLYRQPAVLAKVKPAEGLARSTPRHALPRALVRWWEISCARTALRRR